MNKKFVFTVFTSSFLLLAMVGTQLMMPATADPAVIRVPTDYSTIQAAINAANPGDIVQVASGTYYEHVIVNKTVSLIGENKSTTIIDGNWTGTILNVTADNVEISGFTINSSDFLAETGGIYISSNGNTIKNNIISTNAYGIHVYSSRGNTISNNTVSAYVEKGVYLANSDGNTISDNIIGPEFSIYATGVYLAAHSDHNVISDNIISSNYWGILVGEYCLRNTIRGNTVSDNPASYGLEILGSYTEVVENTISGNYHGIDIDYGSATVVGNTISDNHIGIKLYQTSYNTFYHNNLINNKEQIKGTSEPLNAWDNGAEGNYWSDYNGTDMNGDGVGDTNIPHQGVDNYPLMTPWNELRIFNVSLEEETYQVRTFSNSTIASFNFSHPLKQISFNITGPAGTSGFCNITIPKALLGANETSPWQVLLDGDPISYTLTENNTHTFIYFTYTHTTHHIQIIGTIVLPEIQTWTLMLLTLFALFTLTAAATTILKKRKP